jgi:glycosyltransferase involved in cell wall biosynthesis
MPFFSIIIPLYNKEFFIENTLNLVLQQTFTDFEIIIVNDGSTDGSIAKINLFNDSRIKIYHQENKGVSVARNKGMEVATGDFFCFLDADDEWSDNYLENLYQTIHKFPNAGMYCSRYKTKIANKKFTYCKFIGISDDYEGYVKDFFKSSLVHRLALTSAVALTKDVFSEIKGFDKEISSGQDLDYWIRIALKYPIVICKNITVTYNYIQENKSLSKTSIHQKKLPNFDQFLEEERSNLSLKKFLDLYRIEYALHFHILGNLEKKRYYLKNVDDSNINKKVKLLFSAPSFVLRKALFLKRYLKNWGVDFSVYH